MTTLIYKGTEYNLILVDPSVARMDGDGSSPEMALKDLPETLANNTCYLFRRVDAAEVLVKHQIDTALVNIMFLGMPKNNDPKWIQDLIQDETINSAWKSDTAQYARVRFWHRSDSVDTSSYNKACIYGQNLEYITFINCYLYRLDSASGENSSSYWGSVSPFFTDGSNTGFKIRLGIYQCKLGCYGIDLDNDSYLDEATGPKYKDGGKATQYYSKWARQYFNFHYVYSAEIDNCVINNIVYNNINSESHAQYNSTTYYFKGGQAIYIDKCMMFKMTNSTINNTMLKESSNVLYEDSIYVGSSKNLSYKPQITLHNIQHNCICSPDGLAAIFAYDDTTTAIVNEAAILSISDITIDFKKFNTSYQGNSTFLLAGINIKSAFAKQLFIENIKLNGNGDVKLLHAKPLHLQIRGQTPGVPFSGIIKNITVDLADDAQKSLYNTKSLLNILYFDFGYVTSSENNLQSNKFQESTTYRLRYNVQDFPQISGLTVNAPYGYIYFNRMVANLGELRCGISLEYANSLDIQKLTFDKLSDQGINIASGGNYLRIREYLVDKANQNTLQLTQNMWSNAVYVDKSNVNLFNTIVDNDANSNRYFSQLCCLNMIQDGRFFARNSNTFAQSWGITREGSSSPASLKLQSNTNANFPLLVGTEPYRGFSVIPQSAGKKFLVGYFANKNFDAESIENGKIQLNLIVRVPKPNEDGSVTYATYFSNPDDWYEDNSIWTDDGYEARKIMVPVEVSSTTLPVEVKVSYNWYHPMGVVYVDPEFHLEDDISRQ